MLWLNTTEIDYSFIQVKETDATGKTSTLSIAVLIYSPVGNVAGQFEENVKLKQPNPGLGSLTNNEPTLWDHCRFWISATFLSFSHAYPQCGFACHFESFIAEIKALGR